MMEVCLSLSRFTTGAVLSFHYLELFLWGIPDLDDKIVHGIGGFALIHQFGFGIVQSSNHYAVFIIVQGDVIEPVLTVAFLSAGRTYIAETVLLTSEMV